MEPITVSGDAVEAPRRLTGSARAGLRRVWHSRSPARRVMGTAPTLIHFPSFCACAGVRPEGADVNMQKSPRKKGFENTAGWAPLHWAAKGNHASVVRLLARQPSSRVPVPSCLSRRACPRCSGCVLVSRCMRAQGARPCVFNAARCDSAFCCRPVRVPRLTLRPMWPVVPPLRRPCTISCKASMSFRTRTSD